LIKSGNKLIRLGIAHIRQTGYPVENYRLRGVIMKKFIGILAICAAILSTRGFIIIKKNAISGIFVFCVMMIMLFGVQSQAGEGKILIAYFTLPESDGVDAVSGASRLIVDGTVTGNVQFVADIIQKTTGGDLFAIKTVHTYPDNHNQLIDAAQNEQKTNARPRLATKIPDLQSYDTIFLGYPIWWYDLPMPIYSFLDEYNFEKKTIIPFTVHGGSRFSGTVEKIAQIEPRANIIQDGLAISRNSVARSESDIIAWLRRIGVAK
jgi:flavodoxin